MWQIFLIERPRPIDRTPGLPWTKHLQYNLSTKLQWYDRPPKLPHTQVSWFLIRPHRLPRISLSFWHFHLQAAVQTAADSSRPAGEVWLRGHLQEAQQGGWGEPWQILWRQRNVNLWDISGSWFETKLFYWRRILLNVGAEWKLVMIQYAQYLSTLWILNICIEISSKLDIEQ